ncbi:MAG: M2 family metallopeptidase [Candidatus Polarisedimenticolia bacterium]
MSQPTPRPRTPSTACGLPAARALAAVALALGVAAAAVPHGLAAPPPGPKQAGAKATVAEARAFIEAVEKHLHEIGIRGARADWVQLNFITVDTEQIAAEAKKELAAAVTDYALKSRRFDGLALPDDVARKFKILKQGVEAPAPTDPAEQTELTELGASMESIYGRGKYCPGATAGAAAGAAAGGGANDGCLDILGITRTMAESRDPQRLLEVWRGWHTISPPMRPKYERFVVLANKGARELGFPDLGMMWRSDYDMPPEAFAAEVERLWGQVAPLYWSLHAYVRARLGGQYGAAVVPPDGPIPAHLLGNIWAQEWANLYPMVAPPGSDPGYDLTQILVDSKADPVRMVRHGESFFTSLGFDPLPPTFWERSLFTKPADRDVVCHASAWDIDAEEDLRIKMCIEVNDEDFRTVHHELGHNFYQRAYRRQPPMFRGGANGAFHEAIGDTIALSITPGYLKRIGLLKVDPPPGGDRGYLMKMALDKVAFLPFGLLVDQWRWKVFSGEVTPAHYNRAWWDLRLKYQGVAPAVSRGEADFDPGAKYHVPSNVSYTRYFLAHILQFQFHRALCREAGYQGPLHGCSIYANEAAGRKLRAMLEMGQSRPWPEALHALTGERRMDATAILDYFAPLKTWLDEQNKGRKVGV